MKKNNFQKKITLSVVVVLIGVEAFTSKALQTDIAKNAVFTGSTYQQEQMFTASLEGNIQPLPVYGFNGNNIRGPSWNNEQYRDSIATLNMQIIRYPGGSISEWWDWKKGWFVNTEGLSNDFQLPQNYANITPVTSGLNELKLLVDQTHCDVLFTLNMISSTLDDQIVMLQKAQSLGIPIKFVELGNELNLPKSIGRTKFRSPQDYGQTSAQWINKLKTTFPGVQIAVVGGNQNYDSDVKNWNSATLDQATNADAIVAHLYPIAQNVLDNGSIDFEKLYNAFKGRFNSQGFNAIQNKAIWITEYNINWSYIPKATRDVKTTMQQSSSEWAQSLATLLMTSEATSISPNVRVIVNHNISGVPIWAGIETQNNTFRQLPNGIGMGIWLKACNGMKQIQKIQFKGPEGNTLQDFRLFGWEFSNTSKRNVLLVNLSDQKLDVNINALKISTTDCNIQFADKNMQINNRGEINVGQSKINNKILELPPFSVATINSNL